MSDRSHSPGYGYSDRPATLDDAQALFELERTISLHQTGEAEETLADVINSLTHPKRDPALDTRVVIAPDGRIVGSGFVDLNPPEDAELDLYVHPDLKAEHSRAILTYLGDWAQARAQIALELAPPENRVTLSGFSFHDDEQYKSFLHGLGMTEIRSFYQMWIDFETPLTAPSAPAGYTLRTISRGDDWKLVFGVRRDAWRDHFGYIERPIEDEYEAWMHYWQENFHDDCWYVAEKEGEFAAICLVEPTFNDDDTVGYVATLAVRRAHRKRGLGSTMLSYGLHRLQAMGKRAVALHVDGSSLTGAVAMYERAGMRVRRRYDWLMKELRPGIDHRVTSATE